MLGIAVFAKNSDVPATVPENSMPLRKFIFISFICDKNLLHTLTAQYQSSNKKEYKIDKHGYCNDNHLIPKGGWEQNVPNRITTPWVVDDMRSIHEYRSNQRHDQGYNKERLDTPLLHINTHRNTCS